MTEQVDEELAARAREIAPKLSKVQRDTLRSIVKNPGGYEPLYRYRRTDDILCKRHKLIVRGKPARMSDIGLFWHPTDLGRAVDALYPTEKTTP